MDEYQRRSEFHGSISGSSEVALKSAAPGKRNQKRVIVTKVQAFRPDNDGSLYRLKLKNANGSAFKMVDTSKSRNDQENGEPKPTEMLESL